MSGSNTEGGRAYRTDFEKDFDALMRLPEPVRRFMQFEAEENYGSVNALDYWRATGSIHGMLNILREMSRTDHLSQFPGLARYVRHRS